MSTSRETNGTLAHPTRRPLIALFTVVVGSLLAALAAAPAAHADSGDHLGVAAPAIAASASPSAATRTVTQAHPSGVHTDGYVAGVYFNYDDCEGAGYSGLIYGWWSQFDCYYGGLWYLYVD
jgi:hypothetical protein